MKSLRSLLLAAACIGGALAGPASAQLPRPAGAGETPGCMAPLPGAPAILPGGLCAVPNVPANQITLIDGKSVTVPTDYRSAVRVRCPPSCSR